MNRREVLGSVAAIFCGLALPLEREVIAVVKPVGLTETVILDNLDKILRDVYGPLRERINMPTTWVLRTAYEERSIKIEPVSLGAFFTRGGEKCQTGLESS